jgi:hypothetical protein
MGCPCTNHVGIDKLKRDRVVGFARGVTLADASLWAGHDVVFSIVAPEIERLYRAHVVCACEPGWTRIGGSTAVIYGRNDAQLAESFAAVPDPVVLVALYDGEPTEGGAVAAIRAAAGGRSIEVVTIPGSYHVNALRDPRVRPWERPSRAVSHAVG